jgi:cytochrome P450
MSGNHPPVTDWVNDFDHTDEGWAGDPYPIWRNIRDSACPVGRSERYGGVWLPTRHDDVAAVAYDTEHFTSRSVIVNNGRPLGLQEGGFAPPITSDPPFHHEARRLLLPAFAPKAIAPLEEFTRSYCHELIDAMLSDAGRADDRLLDHSSGDLTVDAAVDYAQHIPVRVIAEMLGFPAEDSEKFRSFIHVVLEGVDLPFEERLARMGPLLEYLTEQVEDHRVNPRDDLTNYLMNATMGGAPLDGFHILGSIGLLLVAGIDTTWSAIGASLWHLAKTPADRQRLSAEPDLLQPAVEEFLRAYAPVTMARLVKDDLEFNGCPMKADDWILLSFPAANRDPEQFDNPDDIVIDRAENRHSAFGLGIHRCVGSNLARMEMQIAIEVWMERFGADFELADPAAVTWSGGQVRGPRLLPVRVGTGSHS